MKKSGSRSSIAKPTQGFLDLAGEAMSVLGHEIVDGKDKAIEAASEKFTAVKKVIINMVNKKTAPPRKKKAVKKSSNSISKKPVSKIAKKATVKKVSKTAKKATRKVVRSKNR